MTTTRKRLPGPTLQTVPLSALDLSAALFVAAMAEHVDAQRGVNIPGGSRETRRRVAAHVRPMIERKET